MQAIEGFCEPTFHAVRVEFERNFRTRGDLGGAVCAYLDGRPVVDLWGRYADSARTRAWQEDTIACVASTGKGITSVCLLRLVERGLIDFDAPVARNWPEFAQAGKQGILVRWLLSHQAGLPAIRKDMTSEAMYEWHPLAQAARRSVNSSTMKSAGR